MLAPFISALGGGAGWRRPPPPPPPPGPGTARKTSRTGVSVRRSGAVATPRVVRITRHPSTAACRAPEAASARPAGDLPAAARRNKPPTSAGSMVPRRIRTALTASPAAMKRPSTVAIVPAATSALASRVRAPAARATSRAVKTSGAAVLAEDMEVAGCPQPQNPCRLCGRPKDSVSQFFGRYSFDLLGRTPTYPAGLCSSSDSPPSEGTPCPGAL
jgi:hypothetical protein